MRKRKRERERERKREREKERERERKQERGEESQDQTDVRTRDGPRVIRDFKAKGDALIRVESGHGVARSGVRIEEEQLLSVPVKAKRIGELHAPVSANVHVSRVRAIHSCPSSSVIVVLGRADVIATVDHSGFHQRCGDVVGCVARVLMAAAGVTFEIVLTN